MTRGRTICFPGSGSFPPLLPQKWMIAELGPCPMPSCATQLTHPAELVQESLVLLREFLDSARLLPVSFAQVDLLLLQLVLQLLHITLQFRHPSFPLSFLVLKSPPQFVFLLFQVLNDGGEEVRKGGKKDECLLFLIYAKAKTLCRKENSARAWQCHEDGSSTSGQVTGTKAIFHFQQLACPLPLEFSTLNFHWNNCQKSKVGCMSIGGIYRSDRATDLAEPILTPKQYISVVSVIILLKLPL